MSRIKLQDARQHLQLSKDSFKEWCIAVRIVAYNYEFSKRKYFIRGEFFAKADAVLIERIKQLHGDNWGKFYAYYSEVMAFIKNEKEPVSGLIPEYIPKSKNVTDFINNLRK